MEYNELKILHQISETISCSLDLDKVLGQIIGLVVEVTDGDSCLLYLLDERREFLILRASKNPHPQLIGEVSVKIGEGITGWVAREAVPVAIERNAMKDERFKGFHNLPEDSYEAFLSVPIIDPTNVVIGVINVQHRQAHRHSERERTLLSIIGHQVGGAIGNARLYAAANRAGRRLLERAELLDLASDAIMVVGDDDLILYWNNGADRVYGWSREEALGKAAVELLQPVFLQPKEDVQREFYENGVWQGEVQHVKRDGKRITVDSRWTIHRQPEGRPAVFLQINTDISHRKLLESQLLQSQKMEAVGRLAGGISHDFNNLLTVIMGRTQLLIEEMPNGRTRDDLNLILRTASRAAGLTHQLLAFSRRQVLQPRVIDLNDVVMDTERMLARVIGEDIRLAVRHERQLGTIKADPGQIEQVILNLVVNARDAMPRGGQITIETANVTLDEFSVSQHADLLPGPYVMLAVSDTGMGMDAKTQSRMFEPFFTTKEIGKGTGLGLATVYGIVEQSGGHVWVYSELDKGTTFKVYFPRLDELPELPVQLAPVAITGTESILLVENEEEVRRFMRDILEMHGYTVIPAGNPSEVLRELDDHNGEIHMAITDIIMPGMNGWSLAKHLRDRQPDMKILFVSGYTEAGIVDTGLLGETDAYLQKPITKDALTRKVREVLDSAC